MPKAAADAALIMRMEILKIRAWAGPYLLGMVLFPLGTLLLVKVMLPPELDADVRLVAGALVFSLGIVTVNVLAQFILAERFNNEMKLIVTAPVHPLSYASGLVAYSVAQSAVTAVVVLSFAPLFDIDVHLSFWLVPLLLLTAVSMTGIAIVVATWAPSMETGNVMANTVGILVVLLSPVYYPIERLPEWLRWLARLSPYTHAAEAVDRVLSGAGGFEREVLILAAITLAGLAIGVAGLRLREA